MSNPFLERIAQGQITSLEQLKAWYRAEAKRLHPDLQGAAAPGVDFDRLKTHYQEALEALLQSLDRVAEPPPRLGLASRSDFLEEFRNLVARGFPVNLQAAARNRAYAASIRLVAAYLAAEFDDPDFFAHANAQTRALKRRDPTVHWYVLQIYWNIGDYQVTGFDYYRRIYVRHLAFIRPALEEGGYSVLLALLEFLVQNEEARPGASTRAGSRPPRPER